MKDKKEATTNMAQKDKPDNKTQVSYKCTLANAYLYRYGDMRLEDTGKPVKLGEAGGKTSEKATYLISIKVF